MPRGLATKTIHLIEACQEILLDIQPTTVRGVAYQLFNRKLIPDMSKRSTDRVSDVLTTARKLGHIPWAWIVDDTRATLVIQSWDDPERFMRETLASYRRDRWAMQPERIELISEKATVKGMLQPVIRRYGLPFTVYHGFSSVTALKNLADFSRSDRRPLTLLYVGDHDPSGRCMSDVDIPGRVAEFGGRVTVERVAIESSQIERYGLYTFSATEKQRDSRYAWFTERYGSVCCELDALPADVLRDLVEHRVRAHLDQEAWTRAQIAERAEAKSLNEFFAAWPGTGVAP